jgi:hypothetical protein
MRLLKFVEVAQKERGNGKLSSDLSIKNVYLSIEQFKDVCYNIK